MCNSVCVTHNTRWWAHNEQEQEHMDGVFWWPTSQEIKYCCFILKGTKMLQQNLSLKLCSIYGFTEMTLKTFQLMTYKYFVTSFLLILCIQVKWAGLKSSIGHIRPEFVLSCSTGRSPFTWAEPRRFLDRDPDAGAQPRQRRTKGRLIIGVRNPSGYIQCLGVDE